MSNKVFFHSGDVVQLKQDIPNKPKMIVGDIRKAERNSLEKDNKSVLLGVRCYWFTSDGFYQERTFSTKDLEKC